MELESIYIRENSLACCLTSRVHVHMVPSTTLLNREPRFPIASWILPHILAMLYPPPIVYFSLSLESCEGETTRASPIYNNTICVIEQYTKRQYRARNTDRRTDTQTDGRAHRQTNRQTARESENLFESNWTEASNVFNLFSLNESERDTWAFRPNHDWKYMFP